MIMMIVIVINTIAINIIIMVLFLYILIIKITSTMANKQCANQLVRSIHSANCPIGHYHLAIEFVQKRPPETEALWSGSSFIKE